MAEAVVDQPRATRGGTEALREVAPLTDGAQALVEKEQAGAIRRAGDRVVVEQIVGLQFEQRHGALPGGGGGNCRGAIPGRWRQQLQEKIPPAAGKGNG